MIDVDLYEKTKADLRSLGNLHVISVLDPEDFSINLVINHKLALKLNLEQWEGFIKEMMMLWALSGKKP